MRRSRLIAHDGPRPSIMLGTENEVHSLPWTDVPLSVGDTSGRSERGWRSFFALQQRRSMTDI